MKLYIRLPLNTKLLDTTLPGLGGIVVEVK